MKPVSKEAAAKASKGAAKASTPVSGGARSTWLRGTAMGVPLALMAAWVVDGYWPGFRSDAVLEDKSAAVTSTVAPANTSVAVVEMSQLDASGKVTESQATHAPARVRKPMSLDVYGAKRRAARQTHETVGTQATADASPASLPALPPQALVANEDVAPVPAVTVPAETPVLLAEVKQPVSAAQESTPPAPAMSELKPIPSSPKHLAKAATDVASLPFPLSLLTAACALPGELGKMVTRIR